MRAFPRTSSKPLSQSSNSSERRIVNITMMYPIGYVKSIHANQSPPPRLGPCRGTQSGRLLRDGQARGAEVRTAFLPEGFAAGGHAPSPADVSAHERGSAWPTPVFVP